tara:strand:- start:308 stop:1567 length:1260 start_codon:yes stop_codon:yes gene_type:complete
VQILYNLLTYLLFIPFTFYWIIKGIFNNSYLDKVWQRFGLGYQGFKKCIWIHAVSVGEVQAVSPLILVLKKKFPQQKIVITTATPTGASRVTKLFGDSVYHCYIPFEFPHAISSFLDSINPVAAMIVETEIWPNLYRGCGVRKIPLILVSARISPSSVPKYQKFLPLIQKTLSHGIIIAAQSKPDAHRFIKLGASSERTHVIGNIKFDIENDDNLTKQGKEIRKKLFKDRPVWIAASTHEGEEKIILDTHHILLRNFPDLLLILAPRHPERFSKVKTLIKNSSFNLISRTNYEKKAHNEVFLLDTMGEVTLFFAASDISFIGGSLVPIGGHNILEPAIQGLPIIVGPYFSNSEEVVNEFIKDDACLVVKNEAELAENISSLLCNSVEAKKMGQRGLRLIRKNKGSIERLLHLLNPILKV